MLGKVCSSAWIYVWILCAPVTLSVAANGAETRVSGLNQLVVIEPDAHERGLPAVQLRPKDDGTLKINIPSTIHVHRFYYDGDKEYQGPIIQGGPTVVVANHPKTGDRKYIDVTLPAGAPVIAYCKSTITYIYPDRRVSVCFSSWNPEKAVVKYHSGQGGWRKAAEKAGAWREKTKGAWGRSPTVQSLGDVAKGSGETLVGAKNTVDSAAASLIDQIKSLGKMIPGVSTLQGAAEDSATQGYQSQLRGLQRSADSSALEFVPTNR